MAPHLTLAGDDGAVVPFGISAMHGPHHVAQKSSITIFPLNEPGNSTVFPSIVFAVNERAGLPTVRFGGSGNCSTGSAAVSSISLPSFSSNT